MPLTSCFGDLYAPATDAIITCANLNTTLDSLQNMGAKVCASPTQVYFPGHTSTTLNVPAGDLPTADPNRIAVYVNGVREFDVALIAGGAYTVTDASNIELSYDPTTSEILVEYIVY